MWSLEREWAYDKAALRYVSQLVIFWQGRIPRKVFLFGLFYLNVISRLLDKVLPHSGADLLLSLAFLWMLMALCAKRFHDVGMTAWWLAPMLALALCASPLLSHRDGLDVLTFCYGLLTIGVPVAMLLMLLFRKGNPSANAYGDVGLTLQQALAAQVF